MLIGRGEEQALLDRLLQSVRRGMSAAVVLRGDPGVGKTALLEYVVESASGCEVQRLAGLESETHLGFAGLHRLLVRYLVYMDGLPGAQSRALSTALGLVEGPPANSFLLGLSVLSLLANVTQEGPVVCIIDDAQWLDAESLEILAFVARRVYAERIGLFFAVREPVSQPVLEGVQAVQLVGLAKGDAADLVVSLSGGDVDRQVAERVAVHSHGNPLVITEASRDMRAGKMNSTLLLEGPVPLGERLDAHFRLQISALPDDCRAMMLFAAALPEPDPGLLWQAAESDGLDATVVLAAVSAGLAEIDPTFRFRHPLIRSAVYSGATESDRRHAHEVLARITDSRAQADLRAWHLASAAVGPDEAVAVQLERSALGARSRGGFLSEAAYLSRAAELSPDASARATRLLGAARAAMTGGAPLRAQALLAAGLDDIHEPFLQAQALKLQANALHRAGRPGHETPATLLAAARVFLPIDAELARETMLEALEQMFVRGSSVRGTTAMEVGRAALDMASSESGLTTILLQGAGTFLCATYQEAAPLIRRALEALAADSALGDEVPRWFALGLFLAQFLWDDRAGYDWLRRCERLARETGALDLLIMTLMPLSGMEVARGNLVAAEAWLDDMRQLARATGVPRERSTSLQNSRLLAWLGRDDDARAAAAQQHENATRIGAGNIQHLSNVALTIIELGRGRYQEAYTLTKAMSDQDTLGVDNESLPNLVETGVRSDHRGDAELALSKLMERALASGTPLALGLLARSKALLASDQDAEALYLEAIAHLQKTEITTDLARAHLLFGEWLRRQKRRAMARERLRLAHDIFEDMGAAAFAERARVELAATGEKHTALRNELTPQESQIARLAADGATNQEIATRLFISGHTVEYHLRKVFRKLGVTSRRRLGAALDSRSD